MRSVPAFSASSFVLLRRLLAVFALATLAACSSTTEYDETAGWSANKLYGEAKEAQAEGSWENAVKFLEKLEARYPYGRFAQQAQLELAYVYWKAGEPGSALAAADRFIKLHPAHPNVDYVYYLKGLVNYNEDGGILSKYTGQDRAERDPKAAREAFTSFRDLVVRFPDSKYAPDARVKMQNLVDGLAEHELYVSRYYMRRSAYLAAANRAQGMIKEFPDSPFVEESFAIMVTAYDKLGKTTLRDDTRRVLETNFPNSVYLKKPWQPRDVPWYQFW